MMIWRGRIGSWRSGWWIGGSLGGRWVEGEEGDGIMKRDGLSVDEMIWGREGKGRVDGTAPFRMVGLSWAWLQLSLWEGDR